MRLALGALLIATGLGKLFDVPGFVDVIGSYELSLGTTAMQIAAWSTIALELAVGAWLLLARQPSAAAALAACLNVGYMVLLTDALLRGLRLTNCGCFGVYFPSPLTWLSPLESLATAALCVLLWVLVNRSHGR